MIVSILLLGTSFFLIFYETRSLLSRRSIRDKITVWALGWNRGPTEQKSLRKCIFLLHEIQESLESGLLPSSEKWAEFRTLLAPWGSLIDESVSQLRSQGAAVLPTIRRFRGLAENHLKRSKEARARASQALAQAAVCIGLVPLFGLVLYFLLPGMSERPFLWLGGCLVSMSLTGTGSLWLLKIADQARWGGLSASQRPWVLASQCAGERFLALVRAGSPPDLAWVKACEFLGNQAPDLAAHWGHSIWQGHGVLEHGKASLAELIIRTGLQLKKSIQASVMDGKPCTERFESGLEALREDIRIAVENELTLLATRALKPLFICVAPAMLGILSFSLFLVASDVLL